MNRLRSVILLALAVLSVPPILSLGIWSPDPLGVDAVSAVTPGYVAVVGAGSTSIPGAPAIPTVEDLVRSAFYLAGGLHKAIDPTADDVLVRPGHAPMNARALRQHMEVVRAVVVLLHDIAPEARISLLLGGAPGSGVSAPDGLEAALRGLADEKDLASIQLQVLDLAREEVETIEVPDRGEVANLYPVPIVLLECDAVINIARYHGPLSAMTNLEGLASIPGGEVSDDRAGRLVDLALLTEVQYTVLDLLGRDHPRSPVVLASPDGIAVDRLAVALAGIQGAPAALTRAGERRLGMSNLASIKVGGLDVPGTWVPDSEGDATTE